ncbi:MAG: hypothetical protein HQ567_12395 [Candidatus Nealsonbacteria bacterium]|nr:hypothetical protein [Candidatus Nealsonbacteria bacterium]
MVRTIVFLVMLIATPAGSAVTRAQSGSDVRPSVYELVINGERFQIEANRLIKLKSEKNPGTGYDVALRIAPSQRLRLNAVQFDYDWLSRVQDDHGRDRRTARLTHELGFTMLITDMGQPLPAEATDKVLKIVADSVGETFTGLQMKKINVGQPRNRTFTGTSGRWVAIRYRDEQDSGHTCLVYVLNGPSFAVSCVIQYVDDDLEDVKTLIKKTLDSFRPLR